VAGDDAGEILLALVQADRLEDLGDHEQQDDRPEAAADGVEERQAEGFRFSASPFHGQSSEGARSEPPVRSASVQYAGAELGSPSIANRMTLFGKFTGSSRMARLKWSRRSLPVTPCREGSTSPIVGSPSTSR